MPESFGMSFHEAQKKWHNNGNSSILGRRFVDFIPKIKASKSRRKPKPSSPSPPQKRGVK
jgi:hypothetical protein